MCFADSCLEDVYDLLSNKKNKSEAWSKKSLQISKACLQCLKARQSAEGTIAYGCNDGVLQITAKWGVVKRS